MRFRALVRLCVSCACGVVLITTSRYTVANAAGKGPAVSPVFQSLLPTLERTKVPVYLPSVFPEATTSHLYAAVGQAIPGHYLVYIGFTSSCRGENACAYGQLEGRLRAAGMKTPSGTRVDLGHNVTGYYVRGSCRAYCLLDTITWDSGHARYSSGAKLSERDLIAFARSAVGAGAHTAAASR